MVQVVSGTQLVLASLGRDDVLRINNGDWVEITDDHREFDRTAGELRQVTVDDATATITFSPALPADLIPSGTDPDTAGRAGTCGSPAGTSPARCRPWAARCSSTWTRPARAVPSRYPPTAAAVVLEAGVTVAFSFVDSGPGRVGDYWIAAARIADASIEQLDRRAAAGHPPPLRAPGGAAACPTARPTAGSRTPRPGTTAAARTARSA